MILKALEAVEAKYGGMEAPEIKAADLKKKNQHLTHVCTNLQTPIPVGKAWL